MDDLSYLRDEKLYVLWKLLNGYRLLGRDSMRFEDFIVPEESQSITAFSLCQDLRFQDIELKGWRFHLELYKKYCPKEYEGVLLFMKEKPDTGFSKSAERIFNGEFEIEDVEIVCMLPNYNFVEWFEFDADLPKKTKDVLGRILDDYIDNFIQDRLVIDTVNFLKFERQKEELLRGLEFSYLREYGDTFVYKTHEHLPYLGDKTDRELSYLFIHTLTALEKLGYLSVERIRVFDMDVPPEKQTENYKVKITVTQKLREEAQALYGSFKKKTEELKPMTLFNSKESILSFKGKEIEISKSKNTNPHYLLETLFKDKEKAWSYDEVAEDWSQDYGRDSWTQYYNAGYSVNEKIEKKTGIKDFLILTNKSVTINKRYL